MNQVSITQDLTVLKYPRRIMKYVLIFCASGSMSLRIDEEDFELVPNSLITITSGQYHFLKNDKNARGVILEFSLGFFCKDDNDIELIFHNGLFCHFAQNEVICCHENAVVREQLEYISEELKIQPYQFLISVHSRIKLLLVTINRAKLKTGEEIWKPDALFLKFLILVRESFEKNYSLRDIANVLGTTEAKLNEQAKTHAGKTAQNVIYGLIVSEAKRLLAYEKLNIKEIAYKLGFNDPFYFSNFFKKHTGVSPKAYQSDPLTP